MGYRRILGSNTCGAASCAALFLLTASGLLAQAQPVAPPPDQDQAPHAWRKASDLPPAPAGLASEQAPAVAADPSQNPAPPPPNYSNFPTFPNAPQAGQLPNPNAPLPGQASAPQMNAPQMNAPNYGPGPMRPNYGGYAPPPQQQAQMVPQGPVPARLTIKPGSYVTVRVSQPLSSDHNQQGDAFYGTLAEPIIVDGVVVAQRGETVVGGVTQAQKAGRVEGTSKLGVELTGISLVDGQQLAIQSQMITRNGQTSVGSDVGAIAGTTALGAAVGAAADWGRGAAIGAGAGAAAGILGVLLTRGRPTVIYPESVLTFRIVAPVEVATDRSPQAFRYAQSRDYGMGGQPAYASRPAPGYGAPGSYAPGYYNGPAYYPYPYYWGPGLSVYVGPGYYRGFRRW
jgi:hypothetical protein